MGSDVNGCQTCGGFGNRHDDVAHDRTPQPCEHDWLNRGYELATEDDKWRECWLCGEVSET